MAWYQSANNTPTTAIRERYIMKIYINFGTLTFFEYSNKYPKINKIAASDPYKSTLVGLVKPVTE